MKGLTARQQDLLDFIEEFTETMHMALRSMKLLLILRSNLPLSLRT